MVVGRKGKGDCTVALYGAAKGSKIMTPCDIITLLQSDDVNIYYLRNESRPIGANSACLHHTATTHRLLWSLCPANGRTLHGDKQNCCNRSKRSKLSSQKYLSRRQPPPPSGTIKVSAPLLLRHPPRLQVSAFRRLASLYSIGVRLQKRRKPVAKMTDPPHELRDRMHYLVPRSLPNHQRIYLEKRQTFQI